MSLNKPVAASLMFHGLLLYFIVSPSCLGKSPTSPKAFSDSNMKVEIVEKPKDTTTPHHEAPRAPKGPPVKPRQESSDCRDSFGGVGMAMTLTNNLAIVDAVYAGYPASMAGVQTGDMIYDILGDGSVRGPIGTFTEFNVLRGGQTLHFRIQRAKICIKGQ